MKKTYFSFVFALFSLFSFSQNCQIYPNTQTQIQGMGIVWEKVYDSLQSGKKVLQWAYEFDKNGSCIKYVYRNTYNNLNNYYFNKYDKNIDGSYISYAFGMYDKDSNEVVADLTENFYDLGTQRLGLMIKTMNNSGVISKIITIPVYDEKNNILFQNYYRLDAKNDTVEKNIFIRNGKTETIINVLKKDSKWDEKTKKVTVRDSAGKILSEKNYENGILKYTLFYSRKYSGTRLLEETAKDEKGQMVTRYVYNYDNFSDKPYSTEYETYKNGILHEKSIYERDGEEHFSYDENGKEISHYSDTYPISDPVDDNNPKIDGEENNIPPSPPVLKTPLTIKELLALKNKRDNKEYPKPKVEKVKPETKETFKDPVAKTGLLMKEKFNEYGLITYQEVPHNNVIYIYEYVYGKF